MNANPDQDLNFYVAADPDPDRHKNNTDPHADPTKFDTYWI
jgi:hypothetical protein